MCLNFQISDRNHADPILLIIQQWPWYSSPPLLLHFLILLLLVVVVVVVFTAIEFSLGGSSPYTSTDKQIRVNIYKQTIQTQ